MHFLNINNGDILFSLLFMQIRHPTSEIPTVLLNWRTYYACPPASFGSWPEIFLQRLQWEFLLTLSFPPGIGGFRWGYGPQAPRIFEKFINRLTN